MNWSKFLFWSSVLTLPTLFMMPKRKPGVVEPGPEIPGPDGEPIVTEPSAPPDPMPMSEVQDMPAEFRSFMPPALPGYSRMKSAEVPSDVLPKLRPLLAGELGTVTKLPTAGRDIAAVIEPHYHPPGGAAKPWGWHKGVSLYERKGANA